MSVDPTDDAASLATPCRVLLVEDEPATRAYLAEAIRADARLCLLAACADCAAARAALQQQVPDVLVTDLALPDGDGTDLIRTVKQLYADCECMVISVFGTERRVIGAIEAGATGYLLKDDSAADIAEAIVALAQGGSPISPGIARHILKRWQSPPAASPDLLTEREADVLERLAKGHTYAETAALLHVSAHTVATHVKHIYRKLAVSSRGAAVFEAYQRGLLRHP